MLWVFPESELLFSSLLALMNLRCVQGLINVAGFFPAEPAAVYEIQLVAFNGNGDGPANRRLVSLTEGGNTAAGKSFYMTSDL